ncbi:DUF5416 domain-containing protein [Campylobacter molothri]|uniref:DUF5416 domain-containing protein n=1 Tax=Campylobacter molothri TaxID=1032242 RepID=UPI001EFA4367|nr:DUF5416 domain-containing protein [Campylobacter sp. RM10537]
MMKIVFMGKSNEYEIEKSSFCSEAFLIKDKIPNRDGIDFITKNVSILEFSDENFSFDEIIKHLEVDVGEDIIIVENFFQQEKNKDEIESILKENITQESSQKFQSSKTFSRIFKNSNFIIKNENNIQSDIVEISKKDELEIFKTLEFEEKEISFVKLEIMNYDSYYDSLNFNLEVFPSGASYKYGISQNTMYVILQGKMSSVSLCRFLKSFIYKNKNKKSTYKTFFLTFNHNMIYKLSVSFV